MENPGEIPKIWHGGIAIHGGLIGGFITGIIVCRTKNLHLSKLEILLLQVLSWLKVLADGETL